jgi:hypothetical protein
MMRAAFKEWAVVVDALGRGGQIIILRKGGISEGRGGFQLEHPRFLLFPTLFHQQRESVISSAQVRFDKIAPDLPPVEKVRLEYFVEVIEARKLNSLADAQALSGQHIWRDEVIAERFDWGREKSVFALAVRVFRLPQAVELPAIPEYVGCKSWTELGQDISTEGAQPVLANAAFEVHLRHFRAALGRADAPMLLAASENSTVAETMAAT